MTLHIVIVTEHFLPDGIGGGEISSHLFAKTLATRHDVTVVTTGHGSVDEMDGFTVKRVIRLPNKQLPDDVRRGEAFSLAIVVGLLRAMKGADIINVQGNLRPSVGAVLASKLNGVPVVATVNDIWATCYYGLHFKDGRMCKRCSLWGLRDCLDRYGGNTAALPYLAMSMRERLFFMSRYDGLMPLSEAMRDVLVQNGIDCHMEVIPNIIDTEFLRFEDLGDEPLLGFVGRLEEGKGLEEAVRIAHGSGHRLRVLGTGPAMIRAKALAKRLGHDGMVEFAGRVPYGTMPEEYHRMSLLLAPFRRIEPLARVTLEANACGRGAVTTTIAGGSENMRDGHNGYVFEPDDVNGMTKTVGEVMEDRELLRSLGRNGRRYVEKVHAPGRVLRMVEAFYRRVIAGRKRVRPR